MKSLFLQFAFYLLLPVVTYSQVCQSGLIKNDRLEYGTPTPHPDDINNAVDFSGIWASGTLADFYAANQKPSPSAQLPSPASGNYVGCWINHNQSLNLAYREGFKGEFTFPLMPNTYHYDFGFDLACLEGFGDVEVSIYGVYNPNGFPSATPTTMFLPNNEDLYGTTNTYLIGTIDSPYIPNCDGNKITIPIQKVNTFASDFPATGITHFFITHSNNTGKNGTRYMAFDNFCLSVPPCPTLTNIDPDNPSRNIDVHIFTPGIFTFDDPRIIPNPLVVTTPGQATITLPPGLNWRDVRYNTINANGDPCQGLPIYENPNLFGKIANQNNDMSTMSSQSDLSISPNPASNDVTVNWSTESIPDQLSISVFNANGVEVQRIENVNGNEGTLSLDVQKLAAGLYFIKVQGAEYAPMPIKFVKKG